MDSLKNPKTHGCGQLTSIAIAVTSAIAISTSTIAADTVISSAQTTQAAWVSDDFTVTSTGSITTQLSTALSAVNTLGTLDNRGTISDTDNGNARSYGISIDAATIVAINNSGIISGNGPISGPNSSSGIYNQSSSITTLNNSGTISSTSTSISYGIYNNDGSRITELNNTGTISASTTNPSASSSFGYGIINNQSTITTLNNYGIISASGQGDSQLMYAIANLGTIGTLNNYGTIVASGSSIYSSYAIENIRTLGTITNSGIIAGLISNNSNNDLIINGGSGTTFGVLTGNAPSFETSASNIGLINSRYSNLVLGQGNHLLNDHIDAGAHQVSSLGTLQVNNSIQITGNYSQDAAANLLLGVTNDSQYGRLQVTGSATVATGSTVALKQLASYGFAQGQRYSVIEANSSNTEFNTSGLNYVVDGYAASGEVIDDGTRSTLVFVVGAEASPPTNPPTNQQPNSPINRATSGNAFSATEGLFRYNGLNPDLMNTFNAMAAVGTNNTANRAGSQLSPMANQAAASQVSIFTSTQIQALTALHLDQRRGGQIGASSGESTPTSGLWGQAFGGTAQMDERDNVAGYHARYSGLMLGADGLINDSWRAGGLFSHSKSSANNKDENKGSSADIKSYGLLGYASYTAEPWYLDLSIGAAQHQYNTKRVVSFTGVNGTAKADYKGMQYSAAVQAGYPIDLGELLAHAILTPVAGLTYSTLRQDSYTEKGDAGVTLHVDTRDLHSLTSNLGAKIERTFDTTYGSLSPSMQLTWRHELRDPTLQSVANFSSDIAGETSFNSIGPKAIKDTGVLTLGLALFNQNNLTVSTHYTGEFGSGFKANTGDVKVRWAF